MVCYLKHPDLKPRSVTSFPRHPHTALAHSPQGLQHTTPCRVAFPSPRPSTAAPCQPLCSLHLLQEAFPVPSPSSQSDHSSGEWSWPCTHSTLGLVIHVQAWLPCCTETTGGQAGGH